MAGQRPLKGARRISQGRVRERCHPRDGCCLFFAELHGSVLNFARGCLQVPQAHPMTKLQHQHHTAEHAEPSHLEVTFQVSECIAERRYKVNTVVTLQGSNYNIKTVYGRTYIVKLCIIQEPWTAPALQRLRRQ
jgi:hypothetical protein